VSWFFEALLQAEKERPKSGNGTPPREPGRGEESFLAPLESLPSVVAEGSPSKPEIPSSQSSSTETEILSPHQASPGQVLRAESPNSFRHLTLPLPEESRLVFQTDPHGLAAEQYRLLRRTLKQEFATGAVLLITSPGEGDGKTLTSLNLSTCLAFSGGDKTLLVEADARRPTMARIWSGAIAPPGVEDAWTGKAEPHQTIHLIDKLSLHLALVARIPGNPSQLINGSGVRQFFAWARENFRWVVIDAPPVLPAADVAELLPLADAALLVIRAQSTPKELARRAFEMLGARLHGVIFNAAIVGSNAYYGYLGPPQRGGTKKSKPVQAATGRNGKRSLLS
jgi:capsular exopolysaccharide synthesis family protein